MCYPFQLKKPLITALLLSLLIALSSCSNRAGDNIVFDIGNYQGKWVVINYWAEWCVPCIKEIPELNELNTHNPAELVVLGVNFDGIQGEELQSVGTRMGISFEMLEHDPADSLKLARPEALPATYVFDQSGKLSYKLIGPQTFESLLERINR